MTQTDILRVLPEAKRETLDALFNADGSEKFGANSSTPIANEEEALLLLAILRDLL